MKQKHTSITYIISAVVILILITAFLAYGTSFKFFKKIYPAVVVGTGLINVYDWEENLKLAQEVDPAVGAEQVQKIIIENKKKKQLIGSLKIKLDQNRINQEFKFETFDKGEPYQKLLNKYFFGEERLFVNYVTLPQLYDAVLRIKYNSQQQSRAWDILDKINKDLPRVDSSDASGTRVKAGQKFEDLAKAESDDKQSGQLGGDLGFVSSGQLLPELETAIKNSSIGQVLNHVVISRDGLHILYPVETAEKDGQKLWHVKHILILTIGYEDWLNEQLSHIFVWRIK